MLRSLLRNFNSIKVQLKPGSAPSVGYADVFQFHKGTIKTKFELERDKEFHRFQFHKGTIKTRIASFLQRVCTISIP